MAHTPPEHRTRPTGPARVRASRARCAFGALAAALLLAPGCGGGEPIDPDPPPPPPGELVLGGSIDSGVGFVELDDFDDVELVFGAQGGFHVWTTLRVRYAAGELYLRREARMVETGALLLRSLPVRFDVPEEAMGDWWEQTEALPSFMCPPPVGITIYDREIALSAQFTDRSGEEVFAEAHLIVVPRCPGGEAQEICERICSD